MQNTNSPSKKKCLLKRIFTSGYFMPTLLILSLAFSFVLLNNEYSLLPSLSHVNENMKTFVLALVGIALVLIIVYFATEVKSGVVRLADSIALSMILFGIAFAGYTYISFNGISLNVLVASILSVVIGLVYLIFRGHYFKNSVENNGVTIDVSPAKNYFKAINKKYSFLTVILTALVIYCALTLGLSNGLKTFSQGAFESTAFLRYFFYLTAIVGLIYLYSSIVKKNLNFVDVILTSGLIVFPIIIFRILFLKETGTLNLFITIIALAVYVVTFVLRIVFLNVRKKQKDAPTKTCYLSKVLTKFGIMQSLFFALAIVTLLAYVLSTDLVSNLIVKDGNVTTVNRNVFAISVLAIAGAGAYLSSLICSIINLKSRKIGLGDGLLTLFLLTSVLSLTVNLVYSSLIYLIVNAVLALLSIVIWIIKVAKSK